MQLKAQLEVKAKKVKGHLVKKKDSSIDADAICSDGFVNQVGLRVFAMGSGCTTIDPVGHKIINSLSSTWVAHIGHGRKESADASAAQAA